MMKHFLTTFSLLSIFLFCMSSYAGLELLLQPIPTAETVRKPQPVRTVIAPTARVNQPLAKEDAADLAQAETNLLTIDKLIPELTNGIQQRHQLQGDFRLTPRERWNPFYVPGGDWRVEVVETIPSKLGSITLVQFKVYVNEKLIGVWKQSFKCQLFQDILVCDENLARGTPISQADFSVKNVDVLQLRQRPVLVGQLRGRHQLRQYLNPGVPLSWRHITTIPLVRRGDIVDVIATEGALMISLKAKAIEDGADGDLIRVSNLSTNKKFQAQVIDDKKVRVLF
jgi:flagella basal body P-ring formation protein FlgA